MAPQRVSDEDRRKLEAALIAALLLIYQGRARTAMAQLAAEGATLGIALDVRARIDVFARERAALVQTGINQRLDNAEGDALQVVRREIAAYNAKTLLPYLQSWAAHQAQSDVYSNSTMQDGQNARAAHQWVWTQTTDFPDDCLAAASASPADYDTLVGIAGGEPPTHSRCACTLDPLDS